MEWEKHTQTASASHRVDIVRLFPLCGDLFFVENGGVEEWTVRCVRRCHSRERSTDPSQEWWTQLSPTKKIGRETRQREEGAGKDWEETTAEWSMVVEGVKGGVHGTLFLVVLHAACRSRLRFPGC